MKKILAIFITLLLAVTLIACGKGELFGGGNVKVEELEGIKGVITFEVQLKEGLEEVPEITLENFKNSKIPFVGKLDIKIDDDGVITIGGLVFESEGATVKDGKIIITSKVFTIEVEDIKILTFNYEYDLEEGSEELIVGIGHELPEVEDETNDDGEETK